MHIKRLDICGFKSFMSRTVFQFDDGVTGMLVSPGDAESLARALARLHDDPGLRQELARAGRMKVVSEFDVHENAARLVREFEAHAKVTA